jgi:plastocyanin
MRRQALICAAIAATVVTVVAMPAFGGTEAKRSTTNVTVGDDYYSCSKCTGTVPVKLKVKKNAKVKWVWSSANTDTHNVKLTSKHPEGVKPKDFTSGDYAVGAKFKKKFKVPGKYSFICTYHKSVMKIDVKVQK